MTVGLALDFAHQTDGEMDGGNGNAGYAEHNKENFGHGGSPLWRLGYSEG